MVKKDVRKYLIVAILLILAYITFLIVKPFISAIIASFILAYIFYPLHKRLTKLTKSEIASATIITILIVLIMLLPLVYISNTLVKESITLYREGVIDEARTTISQYFEGKETITNIANGAINKLIDYLKQQGTNFLTNLPGRLFDLLITVYTTFAFLIVGERFLKQTKRLLPVKQKDELIKDLGETTYSIVYGLFVTAIIEFVLAFIAFKIIGTSAALILALLIGFLAFIPFLGPSIIWVPYALIEALRHNYRSVIIIIILGVILFFIETFLRAKIIGDRSKVHPAVILIGTIGGIKLLGFIGLVAGPVILSAVIKIIEEYYPEIPEIQKTEEK